jgi:nucleoid DNA-binding protein
MNNTTTKANLVARIDGNRKHVAHVVQRFLDEITADILAGKRVELRDFGVFDSRIKPAHMKHNPRTMDPVAVPERRVVMFKPGRALRDGA